MFYLAIIDWENPQPDAARARAAVDALPGPAPAPAPAEVFRAPHAVLVARPPQSGGHRIAAAFSREPNGPALIGDVRLHNRAELTGMIGSDAPAPDASDAAVVLAAFRRWGGSCFERLLGDFAFVVWDAQERTAWAARDAFGTRPLFYADAGARFGFASDPEALAAALELKVAPHEGVVWDYLNWTHRHVRQTPWRGVRRVSGGHVLRVAPDGREERRWFVPPTELIRFSDEHERDEAYREALGRAVARRLEPNAPMLAELSAGLDSTAVVLTADRIRRAVANPEGLPPLIAVTGACPGLACDEGPAADRLAAPLNLGRETWNALDSHWPEVDFLTPCHHRGEPQLAGFEPLHRMAAKHHAAAILSGHGGDEAVFEGGLAQDLALEGAWWTLARCTLLSPHAPWEKRWGLFKAAVLTASPLAARRAFRRIRPRPVEMVPLWAGPAFAAGVPTPPLDDADRPLAFVSRAQEYTWRALTDPALSWGVEGLQLDAARRGFERRFPFLDAEFTRFVLAIHPRDRINDGWSKYLTRSAFRGIMPEEIRAKRDAVTYPEYIQRHTLAQIPRIREIIEEGPWRSEPYVKRSVARDLLKEIEFAMVASPQWGRCRHLWVISRLELWLRRIDAS